MEVRVVRVPGRTVSVELEDGATVGDALHAADIAVQSNEAVKLNGTNADTSATLNEGDKVIIAKGAKGNA